MKAKSLWKHAVLWLETNTPQEISRKELHAYFYPRSRGSRPKRINDIFRAFLKSLTQAGMTEGVIVGAMPEGIDSLAKVTFKFSPSHTYRHYAANHLSLFAEVKSKISPTGKLHEEGLWPKYCRSIISTARFLQEFKTANEFYDWAEDLQNNPRLRAALPLILSEELFGAGFALACNILIDLGYEQYAKPDRHIKRLLEGIGFLDAKTSDYKVLQTVFDLADEAGVTPYALDKALFLIGSGKYFRHKSVRVPNKKTRTEQFLTYVQNA